MGLSFHHIFLPDITSYIGGVSAKVAGGASGVNPEEYVAYVSLLAILVLILALRFFSNRDFFGDEQIDRDFENEGGKLSHFRRTKRIDNLFLKFEYSSDQKKHGTSFLRTLEKNAAALIVPEKLKPGAQIVLHVHTLPGFPQSSLKDIHTKVISCRPIDKERRHYLLNVRFEPQYKGAHISSPLFGYIDSLAKSVG